MMFYKKLHNIFDTFSLSQKRISLRLPYVYLTTNAFCFQNHCFDIIFFVFR